MKKNPAKNTVGLYIGRFQPFHLGHLSAIKQALEQVERLYIGIGSSQYSHEPKNPFTAKERQKMIELGLKDHGFLDRCEIFLIPDIHNNQKWVSHVQSIVPDFDMVFVGNDGIVKTLFEGADMKVVVVKRETDVSATAIRHLIVESTEWKTSVTPSVYDYLIQLKAEKRIKPPDSLHPSTE